MHRTAALLAVALLLVAGAALPAVGSATGAAGTADPAAQVETPNGTNATDGTAAPGAQFAGVVAVQGAEVAGEVEGRAFGISVARARSNGSKAGVVAAQFESLANRTEALADRKRELAEARENGSITEARYRAEVAALAARNAAVERQLNQTEAATNGLPPELLESRGVNATAIDRLRNDSRSLKGPEVAAIARSIAGPPNRAGLAGGNATRGPPVGVGPSGSGRPTATGGAFNTTDTTGGSGAGRPTVGDGPGAGNPGKPGTPNARPGGDGSDRP